MARMKTLQFGKFDQLARACDQLAASTPWLRGSCLRFSNSWSVGLPDNGFFALDLARFLGQLSATLHQAIGPRILTSRESFLPSTKNFESQVQRE
jgi:hypothetical protein